MPKKKKVKKTKKAKKAKKVKKVKIKNSAKSVAKPIEKKNSIPGQDEKPEIKKIKKQPTEKRIYNLKDFVVYPKHGVGKITAIEKAKIGEIDIQFYKILVEKEKLTLTVPINQQSKLRPISSINQINKYNSHHTDSIITENKKVAERFFLEVDSAILMHNVSTQFADGGEFGMGAEIGISTSKVHARGPVGVAQLTSFKYKVKGSGQIRP